MTPTSTPRKRRRWVGLRGRSLRFQIVVVLVVLLTVSFAIVALVTAIALRTFLIQRLDQQLAAAGTRFSVSLEHPADTTTTPTTPTNSAPLRARPPERSAPACSTAK